MLARRRETGQHARRCRRRPEGLTSWGAERRPVWEEQHELEGRGGEQLERGAGLPSQQGAPDRMKVGKQPDLVRFILTTLAAGWQVGRLAGPLWSTQRVSVHPGVFPQAPLGAAGPAAECLSARFSGSPPCPVSTPPRSQAHQTRGSRVPHPVSVSLSATTVPLLNLPLSHTPTISGPRTRDS